MRILRKTIGRICGSVNEKLEGVRKIHEWFKTQELHRSKKKVLFSFRVGWLYGQKLDSRNPYLEKKRKYYSKENLDIIHLIDKYFNRSITSLEEKKVKSLDGMHFLTNIVAINSYN